MAQTTRRLLRLLSLLESRSVWTGPELARSLDVTERTVRRDVERLREIGYPVRSEQGVGGGYRLGAGRRLPPLVLDDDEAVAVAVALRLAATSSVDGLGESAIRTLSKLDQVLPARLQDEVAALDHAMVVMPRRDTAEVGPDVLVGLSRAIRDVVRVRFAYAAATGVASQRDAEPYRLVTTGRRWYLLAFDLDRQDWRTFRVDRITDPVATTFRYTPRAEPDAAAFVADAVDRAARPVTATVALDAPVESVRAVAGRGDATVRDDGWTGLTARATDLHHLAWYFSWVGDAVGAEIRVVEPPQLSDEFARLSRTIARHAGRR